MYIPNKLNKLKTEKYNNSNITSYSIDTNTTEDIKFSSQKYSFKVNVYISNVFGNENDIGRYVELPDTPTMTNGIIFSNTTIFQENNPTFNFTGANYSPSMIYVQITNLNTNEIVYKKYCGRNDGSSVCSLPPGNFLIEFIEEII